jgi:protein-S-isoprenylcysteine O-methyltransferase Ste14
MLLAIVNPLNESAYTFPILECIHILAFALSIGTIAIVDFRLLDIGMVHQTSAELLKDTATWTLVGLVIMIFSGLLLFSSAPDMYYLNWAFLIKIACLLLAIVFNYTIHRKVARSEEQPANRKLVACVSLALWGAVVFGGIFIAFINQGLT